MHDGAPPRDCLDGNTVVDLLAGALPAHVRQDIEHHLDGCDLCRALVAIHADDSLDEDATTRVQGAPGSERRTVPVGAAEERLPSPQFERGDTIDHFVVMRLIGRGGMGEVFLARDKRLGRKVALKTIVPGAFDHVDQGLARFEIEARALARISHPSVVTIHAVGECRGIPYVALEYVEGETLRARVADGPLQPQEAMRIMLAVAEGLEEAHRFGVLHRDLKPTNVLIGTDGRVRVLDFGLAQLVVGEAPASVDFEAGVPSSRAFDRMRRRSWHTQTDIGVGTPTYMAPEQWQEQACARGTDMWAWGTIVYEIIAGRRPYMAGSIVDLATLVCRADDAPPLPAAATLPTAVRSLLRRCLLPHPVDRPSAAEAVETLRGVLDGPQPRASMPPSDQCPFRGLLPFRQEHAAQFVGRNDEIAAFVEALRVQPIMAVVGASGSGKSSFVRAGVIPRLHEQKPWQVLCLRPGARPFATLAKALIEAGFSAEPDALTARLRDAPGALALCLRALAHGGGVSVLLVIDQLEELFTLLRRQDDAGAWLAALCSAADDALDPVRVVVTLRSDHVGKVAAHASLLRHVTVLRRPDEHAMREMLTLPAARAGYRFEDDGLVGAMVADVYGEPSCLPLLQFAAQRMWQARDRSQHTLTRQAYEQMGGVAGALATHADALLAGLGPREQVAARRLLLRLVTPERTRRVVTRAAALAGLPPSAEQLLVRLTEARLVSQRQADAAGESSTAEAGAATVELAHESLIVAWTQLSAWIDESKAELRFVSEVDQAAALWQRRGEQHDELWGGEALQEALRLRARSSEPLPSRAAAFLDAAAVRERRQVRRRRLTQAIVMLALLVASAVLWWQKREADTQRGHAEQQRGRAEQQRAIALRESAALALRQGYVVEARSKLRMALELDAEPSAATRALWWQLKHHPQRWRRRIGGRVYSVTFAPGDRALWAAGENAGLFSIDGSTGRLRRLRGFADQVQALARSDNGLAAGAEWGGRVTVWRVAEGTVVQQLAAGGGVFDVAFAPGGALLAVATAAGQVQLWDVVGGTRQHTFAQHDDAVRSVAFSADGTRLASAGLDGVVQVYDMQQRRLQGTLDGHTAGVRAVAFSADGRWLVSGGLDNTVRVWRADKLTLHRTIAARQRGVLDVAIRPDSATIASAGADGSVGLWSLSSGRGHTMPGHARAAYTVAFSADGSLMASGGRDEEARLWDVAQALRPPAPVGHRGLVSALGFSPNGTLLVSGSGDGTARAWTVEHGRAEALFSGHYAEVSTVAVSPDGGMLASGGRDHNVRLWDLASGVPARTLQGHLGYVFSLAFAPKGEWLASASADRTVRLWQLPSGEPREILRGHEAAVLSVAVDANGTRLASGSADAVIRVWSLPQPAQPVELRGHEGPVWSVAFAPGGERLVSAGADGSIRLWSLPDGTPHVLGRHTGRSYRAVFHPDGRRVISAGADSRIRVWDIAAEPPQLAAFTPHLGEINNVAVSPDGRILASGSDDQTVRLLRLEDGLPLWRGPLLANTQLYTHAEPRDLTQRWQGEVRSAVIAAAAIDGPQLCMVKASGVIELWDRDADTQLAARQLTNATGVQRWSLVTLPAGCAVATGTGVLLVNERATPTRLSEGAAGAIAREGDALLVAHPTRLLRIALRDGEPSAPAELAVQLDGQVTAMLSQQGARVLGYRDGRVEQLGAPETPPLQEAPAAAVTRLALGPQDTLMVGYADGHVGLWQRTTGAKLLATRLHGRVTQLAYQQKRLVAGTDLGAHHTWDLAVLEAERCSLMEQVWRSTPTVWQDGGALLAPPPSSHPCQRKDRD